MHKKEFVVHGLIKKVFFGVQCEHPVSVALDTLGAFMVALQFNLFLRTISLDGRNELKENGGEKMMQVWNNMYVGRCGRKSNSVKREK